MHIRLKILYSVITIFFITLATYNILHNIHFDPQVTNEFSWQQTTGTNEIVIKNIKEGGAADLAGIQVNDIVLSIDDKEFSTRKEAEEYLETHQVGDRIKYKLLRGNNEVEVFLTLAQRSRLLPLLFYFVGMLFLLVGFFVVFKKPEMRTPRLFYFFSFTFFNMVVFDHISSHQPFFQAILIIHLAGIILWGPSMVHFFTNFPLRIPLLTKHPKIVFIFYLPSILAFTYVLFFNKQSMLGDIVIGLYFFATFYLFGMNSAKIKNPHEKKSIRVISLGMYLGLTPLAIFAYFPDLVLSFLGSTAVAIVFGFMGLVPISFGYSIMRYGLMDVEIIVKKSLVYSMVTSFFVLLYFLIVMGLGSYLADNLGFAGQTAHIIFLVIVAIAFQPVRMGIQGFVDRRFYRNRYQYQKTLLKLSQELPGIANMQGILKRIADTISEAMNVSNVMIHLYDQSTNQYILRFQAKGREKTEINWNDDTNSLIAMIKHEKSCCLFYKIEEDARYNNLSLSEKVKIEKAGIVLSIPMFYQDALIGIIGLGPKSSGQVYNLEDLDLLQTVAGNAAIALVNARLHQEDLRKQAFENELVIARNIQEGLLPKEDPHIPGLEITGISLPSSIVGGDYFDYIPLSKNQILLLVGDVSGKGMPAAIYMSKVQGMIQMGAGVHSDPAKILMDVNRRIFSSLDSKSFITMTIASVDAKLNKVEFCRAGHTPALVKKQDSVQWMTGKGIGLGLEEGEIFDRSIEEQQIKLNKGDYFILFSDGLTEAANSNQELYGEERLQNIVEKGMFSSASELKDLLLDDLKEFQKDSQQTDDITIVIVRFL